MRIVHLLLLSSLLALISCQTTKMVSPSPAVPERIIGQLRVGFDIDDTVLFSRDNFLKAPKDTTNSDHVDFSWINTHDSMHSVTIEPTAALIGFLRAHGHEVFFITARPGDNGEGVAKFLTSELGFDIQKDKNLFFAPKRKDPKTGNRYTTKHEVITKLGLHIFYGDADNDMVAASIAGVRGVRVVRDARSVEAYSRNYFGDTQNGATAAAPFSKDLYKAFLNGNVGPYGETIYPIYYEEETLSE